MTTLEKIREGIDTRFKEARLENTRFYYDVLDIIDKYAEEPIDGRKVSRVLVCGDNHWGGLYYLEEEPSVRPQEQTGHWIAIDEEPHEVWECDHCGFVIDGSGCVDPYDYRDTYKYCPNCGERMVEPQERSE